MARRGSSPRLVGRDDELSALEVTLEQAASGSTRIVVLAGEAGVGKSRLAQEFSDRVMAMATEFTRLPRSGTREYAFYFGVFPTNRPVAPDPRNNSEELQ